VTYNAMFIALTVQIGPNDFVNIDAQRWYVSETLSIIRNTLQLGLAKHQSIGDVQKRHGSGMH